MEPTIVRPELTPDQDKWKEIELFLTDHWDRAVQGRSTQVEDDYNRWTKNYQAIPLQKTRTLPWQNSSNIVVPVIRIYVDTFIARTLNIIFATKPLYQANGYPSMVKEALEAYIDQKALQEWKHYNLTRQLLHRGNKNGTAVIKVPWVRDVEWEVTSPTDHRAVTTFEGPKAALIPFEDFYVYPVTANNMDEVQISFHRVRFVEEEARRRVAQGRWKLEPEELETALKMPSDVKRSDEQQAAGVTDQYLRELQIIECHFKWELEIGRYYRVVGLYCPAASKLIDLYFYPYPVNVNLFHLYTPFPREDLFYGESMAQLLEDFQEEASAIHNDRRNNSYVANAPVFKRRNGALIPNPSTNWYPGKVFDLESMDDFELMMIGRNYDSMLDQEANVFQLSERLSGIGPVMQGNAAGMMGKRGIYNAAGTLAVLSESNQRQDTNIRDVREVLSSVGKTSLLLQSLFGTDDETIDAFPAAMQEQIREALKVTPSRIKTTKFTVKASEAGSNKEVEKQNLMQIAQVLSQYGQTTFQLAQQLANPQLNPSLRLLMGDIVAMHSWMAKRLLRGFGEFDGEEVLPDVAAAINATVPGGGNGTKGAVSEPGNGLLDLGGGAGTPAPMSREFLEGLAQIPSPAGAVGGPNLQQGPPGAGQ